MFNIAFPLINAKSQTIYLKREPWMTLGLLTSSRTKHRLFTKKLNKPSEANITVYKDYNRLYNKLKRKAKKDYYYGKLLEQSNNIKNTWNIIKEVMNTKHTLNSLPNEFDVEGTIITNKQEIADKINHFFSNIGQNLNNSVPASPKHPSDYYTRPNPNTLFLIPTDTVEIQQIVNKFKPKSSCDKDNISAKILKFIIPEILTPITHITNLSLMMGKVPNDLKIAKVIPIFKSGNHPCSIIIDPLVSFQYFLKY